MLLFIVFYGLDWVATVPPTVALCRELFGADGTVVFGWVFASHQVGAAIAASGAGLLRTELGSYDVAWLGAGALCVVAAGLSVLLRRPPAVRPCRSRGPADGRRRRSCRAGPAGRLQAAPRACDRRVDRDAAGTSAACLRC